MRFNKTAVDTTKTTNHAGGLAFKLSAEMDLYSKVCTSVLSNKFYGPNVEGQLKEIHDKYIPSYCFNWSDPAEVAGHKQSGDINNPDNFENHKQSSGDYCTGPLFPLDKTELDIVYQKYYDFLKSQENNINEEHYKKYLHPLLK
jgi:hypothetical protein